MRSQWVEVGGVRMHARVSSPHVPSDRPPVVLVHGMVVASAYMVPLAERLAAAFCVYAPDLPGYGDSDKPNRRPSLGGLADGLAGWMDAMKLPRSILIGNSFGCQILADLAVRHARLVDRLVLQGPTVDPEARSLLGQLRRIWRNSRLEKGAMAAITRRDYAKAGWLRAWRTMGVVLSDRIEDKLARIAAPVLVVVGSEDPLVPIPWARRVADTVPHGELVVVPGATHTMNYVSPAELARAIWPFLVRPATDSRRAAPRVVGA